MGKYNSFFVEEKISHHIVTFFPFNKFLRISELESSTNSKNWIIF